MAKRSFSGLNSLERYRHVSSALCDTCPGRRLVASYACQGPRPPKQTTASIELAQQLVPGLIIFPALLPAKEAKLAGISLPTPENSKKRSILHYSRLGALQGLNDEKGLSIWETNPEHFPPFFQILANLITKQNQSQNQNQSSPALSSQEKEEESGIGESLDIIGGKEDVKLEADCVTCRTVKPGQGVPGLLIHYHIYI